jgi:hypothetical protein
MKTDFIQGKKFYQAPKRSSLDNGEQNRSHPFLTQLFFEFGEIDSTTLTTARGTTRFSLETFIDKSSEIGYSRCKQYYYQDLLDHGSKIINQT